MKTILGYACLANHLVQIHESNGRRRVEFEFS